MSDDDRGEVFRYEPDGRVLTRFFLDRSPVSIIQGPVGSGTSTACCHKMWAICCEQKANSEGVRLSRWIVVRNTFDELKQTTLKTWKYWFVQVAQKAFGDVKMSNPPEHNIEWVLPDDTLVRAEFIFLSLDQEDDISKLTSMECTGVWFNEVQYTDKAIFDMAHSRAMQGRYPPKLDGGPTWKGVIADLNAPPEGHWLPYMRGDVPFPEEWDEAKRKEYSNIDGWAIDFVQPPGLIETYENGRLTGYLENNRENRLAQGFEDIDAVAENQKWIDESYEELVKGKSKRYIDTYVMNRVGLYQKGQPVFESFVPETHISRTPLEYRPEWPLIVGLDFARNPAAIICQLIRGQLCVLDEFGMKNVTAGEFAPMLKSRIMQNFPGVMQATKVRINELDQPDEKLLDRVAVNPKIQFWGDPTGGSRGQATNWTPYLVFAAHGMKVFPAPGNNDIQLRLETVTSMLNKMVAGSPALLISCSTRMIKAAMSGGYHFAQKRGAAGGFHEEPQKDDYADYADGLQYAALGAGLGHQALHGGRGPKKPERRKKERYSLKRRRRA